MYDKAKRTFYRYKIYSDTNPKSVTIPVLYMTKSEETHEEKVENI